MFSTVKTNYRLNNLILKINFYYNILSLYITLITPVFSLSFFCLGNIVTGSVLSCVQGLDMLFRENFQLDWCPSVYPKKIVLYSVCYLQVTDPEKTATVISLQNHLDLLKSTIIKSFSFGIPVNNY